MPVASPSRHQLMAAFGNADVVPVLRLAQPNRFGTVCWYTFTQALLE